MKRFLPIILVLALLIPGALLAQEELSLESLAEALAALTGRVASLEETQALEAVEQRIKALEEALAKIAASSAPPEGEACLIIVGGGDFMPLGNQLRPETLDEYLKEFGETPGDSVVKDARFYPDSDILEVRYKPLLPDTTSIEIIERWQGCEFQGVEFETVSLFE